MNEVAKIIGSNGEELRRLVQKGKRYYTEKNKTLNIFSLNPNFY